MIFLVNNCKLTCKRCLTRFRDMWKQRRSNSNQESEAYDIARGLYDSKVNIKRPPSAAQQGVYTSSCRGPPVHVVKGMKAKPHSAMGRISSETSSATVQSKTRPPWRPFSGHAALSQPTPVLSYTNRRFEDTTGKEEELLCGFTQLPTVYQDRCLPNSLTFLTEWLTEDVPSNWPICFEPQHSFVFVPCVQSEDCAVLPIVPPIQQPKDLLLYNPVPQVKKYKPPKPRFRTFLEDDDLVGKHSGHTNVNSKASLATSCGNIPLHDIYEGKRTTDIIRQEIEDLERLLQGIGNPTGSSVVVRYQSDINNLKDMIKNTLEGYQIYGSEDVPRCLTPLAASFQEDLVRYPEQHETIFQNIKQRRDQCVRELADIERDIMNKVT